ncbi:thiazole synthase [Arsenophonus nasoniae]|nr:thiazole synthase [Arsenophonus nasoniae]QBY45534.1 Thiazole synthase [Arsenophonus nasoniae]WGM01406.1 thiazole synthase [Arsenophonus nasoniae]WGM05662.1 thiazole synthase [Arsenophonus nasoniae]WGM10674.1 thiazole synthase [Arsenophonus nasoniae]WGM15379.1 thiazole synthase [Arsenophonus nasoniae]
MLKIADTVFQSRLFMGSGKFANSSLMTQAIQASGSQLVTIAMKRVDLINKNDDILLPLQKIGVKLLPNTSGAKNAQQALFAARLARDALATNWIKLEIHPDTKYLLPDPIETLKAAELLVKEDFIVLPYCNADPVLCRHLEEVGCAAVMPLGAPIGTNKGLITYDFLQIIIEQASIPVVVDAGLGAPSHALAALEIGADAVLVNTAIAVANDPVAMAHAFRIATEAGDIVQAAGLAAQHHQAAPSSPLTQFLEVFQ